MSRIFGRILNLNSRETCQSLQAIYREQLRLKRLEDKLIAVDTPVNRMPADMPGMSQVAISVVELQETLRLISIKRSCNCKAAQNSVLVLQGLIFFPFKHSACCSPSLKEPLHCFISSLQLVSVLQNSANIQYFVIWGNKLAHFNLQPLQAQAATWGFCHACIKCCHSGACIPTSQSQWCLWRKHAPQQKADREQDDEHCGGAAHYREGWAGEADWRPSRESLHLWKSPVPLRQLDAF